MGIVEKFFNTYANDIQAVVVLDEVNRYYFSGYESSFGVLLISLEKSYFITDPRYVNEAKNFINEEFEIVECRGMDGAVDFVAKFVRDHSITALGYESDTISHNNFSLLKSIKTKLVSVSSQIARMRSIKTDEELGFIRTASEIAEKAFNATIKKIKSGVTECDVMIELEHQVRLMGADGVSFDTIVAFGERSASPHSHPQNVKLEKGTHILIDFGAKYNHYCSDMTRVLSLGEPSSQIRALHSAVFDAQKYALSNIRAGLTGREIDSLSREYLTSRGLGDKFTHALGHGVGLEIHEAPTLSQFNYDELEENMVVTCEPGVYLEDIGGIRIEDTLIVKNNGIELLNKMSKDIIIL